MRSFISATAVIFALVLTAVAVPLAWADVNVVREEGFVRLTDSLGKDQAFQAHLAAAAVVGLESKVELPAPVERLGASLLKDAATAMSTWPEYPQAWNETVRRSHRLNFARNAGSGNSTEAASLVLDVGPLAGLAAHRLAATTGFPIAAPKSTLINIGGLAEREQVERLVAYAPMWWLPAVGAILLLALALFATRRWGALVLFAGLGLAALAGLWEAVATVLKGVGDAGLGGTATGALFTRELLAASVDSFTSWIVAAGIGGGVLALVGLLAMVLRPKLRRAFQ